METLASLFVTLVIVAGAAFPQLKTNKVLEPDQAAALSGSVLSETTDAASMGTSVRSLRVQDVNQETGTRTEFMNELRSRIGNTTASGELNTVRERQRAELRERLKLIKDEKKQKIVERLSENLTNLNKKWVEHWSRTLERLGEILVKLGELADRAEAGGKDVTTVRENITLAQGKILAAQEAVAAQDQKTYQFEITGEDGLGQDVRAAINSFHNDIKSTRALVVEAKESVVAVRQALAQVLGKNS